MITLGDCNGCAGCDDGGSVVCDRVAFSNLANGMPARPAEIVGSATEGNPIAFWVNRYPNCFIYDGDPTTYEANEGHPATDIIPEDQYYFDAGARSFWQNQSGTMTAVATPSWFKVGAITGTVKIQLTTCECTAHMITGTADVPFSFADGDDTSVAVSLTTTCPGPPVFWGCRDQPGGLEAATLYFEDVSATGGCVTTGHLAQGVVTCTHTYPHRDWGSSHYSIKQWEAVISKPIGFLPFDWDSATYPVDRYRSASKEITSGGDTFNGETKWPDTVILNPSVGSQVPFYEYLRYDTGCVATGGPITGAVSPDSYFIDYGGGETLTQGLADQSGTLEDGYLIPESEINSLLADAITNDPDGTAGIYAIRQGDVTYTWKLKASAYSGDFLDPAFDSAKTYEYTGAALPASPYNPDDWTETADTGFDYDQTLVEAVETTPTYGTLDIGSSGDSAYMAMSVGDGKTFAATRKVTIDASNSLTGNPLPARVFVTVSNYEDTALVSTEPETEITDTTFDLEVTSLGGSAYLREKRFELRVEYVNAPFCGPTPSAVFVCHPGLTSDPCA